MFSSVTSSKRVGKPPFGNARILDFSVLYALAATIFLGVAFRQSCARIDQFTVEILIFVVNGFLSIYGQVQSIKRQASINYISFFFCYLFMAVTPLFQLGGGNDPVYQLDSVVLRASLMGVMFTILGIFFTSRIPVPRPSAEQPHAPHAEPDYFPLFFWTTATAATALVLYGKLLFTSREGFSEGALAIHGDPQIALLISTILTSIPPFGAAIGLRAAWTARRIGWTILFAALMLVALLLNNPIVTARFELAGFGIFLIDYLSRGKAMKLIAVFLVAGVLLAPAFQVFRYEEPGEQIQTETNPFSNTELPYDYDAFQMLCYTIVTVDQGGVVWGANILGSALFFVPRSWWPEKPEQSSHIIYFTIHGYREVGTNNLSNPVMAEGYYAFGWIGALLISLLYWGAVSRIVVLSRRSPDSFVFLLRCVFAGLTLIVLRGTLIVAAGVVAGSAVSAGLPWLASRGSLRIGKAKSMQNRPAQLDRTRRK